MPFPNPLNLFRPRPPEDAAMSGAKMEAPSGAMEVRRSIEGVVYSVRHGLSALLSAPTRIAGGALSFAGRVLDAPNRYIVSPVTRWLDSFHKQVSAVVGGEVK